MSVQIPLSKQPAASSTQEWRGNWPMVLACVFAGVLGSLHVYTFGLFIIPLEDAFGWTRTEVSGALTLQALLAAALAPFMGMAVDRWGSRKVGIPGVILFLTSFAALGLVAPSIWTFWWLFTVVALGAAMIAPQVWTTAIAGHFDAGRGLALSVVLCGAGICGTVSPILGSYAIDIFGWRMAYGLLALLWGAITLPLLLLFLRDSPAVGQRRAARRPDRKVAALPGLDARAAFFSLRFAKLLFSTFFVLICVMAMLIHFVPILVGRGFDHAPAAAIAGAIGALSLVSRIGTGLLLDRMHGAIVGGAACLFPLFAAIAIMNAHSYPVALIAAGLLGFGVGANTGVGAYLTSRYFGVRSYGVLFGTIVGGMSLATGLGPLLSGMIYDWAGDYGPLLWTVMPISILCSLMIFSLGAYPDFGGADVQETGTETSGIDRQPALATK